MKKTIISLCLVIISLLGILDAGYITYSEFAEVIPPCQPPFDCGTVLHSPWSRVGPIPLSLIGMLYYVTILCIGSYYFLKRDEKSEELLLLISSMGFLFSLYLVSVMAFILDAWCLFCLFSATFSVLLFLCSALVQRKSIKRSFLHAAYTQILKRIFFQFDPEFVHDQMTATGKILGSIPLLRDLTRKIFAFSAPKLSKKINGIHFPNPVGLSAGFDYNADLTGTVPAVGFGFATIGTVTFRPYEGNSKPRLGRYPRSKALLVNKGFKSIGAKAIIEKLQNCTFEVPIGISIGSTNTSYDSLADQIDDIWHCFTLFEESAVRHSYYELNISCPNTLGGQPFTTPARLEQLLRMIDRLKIERPVYIKMPIDLGVAKTLALLDIADHSNIAGVIFGNLTKDKNNPDLHPADRQHWQSARGNVSGKPTRNRSNALIVKTKAVYRNRFTIIGTGGIFTPEDAAQKVALGADLVQLITGMIYEGPQLIGAINEYLIHTTQKENYVGTKK